MSTAVGRVGCVEEKHPYSSKTGIHSSERHWHLQKPDSHGFYQVGTIESYLSVSVITIIIFSHINIAIEKT